MNVKFLLNSSKVKKNMYRKYIKICSGRIVHKVCPLYTYEWRNGWNQGSTCTNSPKEDKDEKGYHSLESTISFKNKQFWGYLFIFNNMFYLFKKYSDELTYISTLLFVN